MSTISNKVRPFLKCMRFQKRFYADNPSTLNTENKMLLTLAASNQVFYDKTVVKQVDVPSFSGFFGILHRHIPTLAILKPGVISVFETSGDIKQIFVSSGTITVNADSSIQVLAEEAHPLDAFDKSSIKDILNKAQDQLNRASNDREKAEAEIALEVAQALDEAVK